MGNQVGVHTEEELEGLSDEDKALLRKLILTQALTSPAIREEFEKDLRIFTDVSEIRDKLREELSPVFDLLRQRASRLRRKR